jgi:hypothetical protein
VPCSLFSPDFDATDFRGVRAYQEDRIKSATLGG